MSKTQWIGLIGYIVESFPKRQEKHSVSKYRHTLSNPKKNNFLWSSQTRNIIQEKRFLAIQWKLSVGDQGENASKMWNKGTQIDDINTNDVPFDGLEPPDGFENHRWLLVRLCQLRHTLICHILEKSPEMLGKKHPKFSIKHICSMHPEKLALRFGKNKFLTSKTK